MDPPTVAGAGALHHHFSDPLEPSAVSSPTAGRWDDSLPPPKLRMMCSYGGHIIPRPHDKSLCYMGGETRIVVADRHTSLADLSSRLSGTLLHGRRFTLKYQLPSEDLDSLVSVTTDEDLDNMIEEYDRLNSSNPSSKSSRLRLFLFLSKPETAASMGSLLDDAKSETWFVDALNGSGLLPRGFSDPSAIDNLLELKDGDIPSKTVKGFVQEYVSPDSPVVETTSSFGSSSSSPSMSNLPPIKVRVDHMNQMAGLDEQLSQLNVGVAPAQAPIGGWVPAAAGDDERSDHGAASCGVRKPPLPSPLQPVQRKFGHDPYSLPSPESKHGGAYNLHSPDSIASDSSIASANCLSKQTYHQDPNPSSNNDTIVPPPTTTQTYPVATTMPNLNYQIPTQQTPESGEPSPPQHNNHDQQQFYHTRPQYFHHPTTTQLPPISSYYAVHPPPQMDHQQYPFYFLPVSQNHPYMTDASATPPLYPAKTIATLSKPDSLYKTTTPGMIQVPRNQFPHQYVNVTHHPHTTMPNSNGGKYGYEYAHPTHDQVYYSQQPSQYQTMTSTSATLLTQTTSTQQQAPESAKHGEL